MTKYVTKPAEMPPGSAAGGDGADRPAIGPAGASDADLTAIVRAWPTLPAAIKAGIVAMVKAGAGDRA